MTTRKQRRGCMPFCHLCLLYLANSNLLVWAFALGGHNNNKPHHRLATTELQATTVPRDAAAVDDDDECFDLIIIGAGASGLFASGAALSFGWKTLLVDLGKGYVGGDCSNAACVPSKALRSIARVQTSDILMAQQHILETVLTVRKRESISQMENVTNLDLVLVESTKFVSKDEIEIVPQKEEEASSEALLKTITTATTTRATNKRKKRRIRAKKFLIATGASPIVPTSLEEEALAVGLPLFTYRTVLSPNENAAWRQFCLDAAANSTSSTTTTTTARKRIVIAGGGPTAVELGQALSRLELNVTLVIPTTVLADEDVALQQSACQILRHDGVTLEFGKRVIGVDNNKNKLHVIILSDATQLPADALFVCVGRKPTVEDLDLDKASIAWDAENGIQVHPSSLRSTTNPRVYACGDCCSAVKGKNRKAAHAAWTGYHAIRNMGIPRILWEAGSRSVHPTVPSVTYTDPELASVGMTRSECIEKYGQDGFVYLSLREEGMDRADMDRQERFVDPCFVELRAHRRTGRILGLTACSPSAAELANEIGLAIQSKLTVRDLARSIHSYPSHGYLLYRLALSMALSSVRGFLDALGLIPRTGGKLYGGASAVLSILQPDHVLPWKRTKRRQQQQWEAIGQQRALVVIPRNVDPFFVSETSGDVTQSLPISFLDFYKNEQYKDHNDPPEAFQEWLESKPK